MKITTKLNKVLFLLFFIILFIPICHSQSVANPFYSGKDVHNVAIGRKTLFHNSKFYTVIARWQKSMREKIAGFILMLKNNKKKSAIYIVLLISFLYGIVHALGPGHRKTVLFSYFMARDARPVEGIMAGFLLSDLHAGSAITLILILYFFVKGSFLNQKVQIEFLMEEISYGGIAALGFILILFKLFKLMAKKKRERNVDDCSSINSPKLFLPIMLSGLVPCPGASSIMIFSLAAGFLALGIFGVVAMSLGMAITISTLSVISILGKRGILRVSEKHARFYNFLHESIETGAALTIFLFGLLMLIPFLAVGTSA